MAHASKEALKTIEREITASGGVILNRLINGNGHQTVTVGLGEKTVQIVVPWSGKVSGRALMNIRAHARRQIRSIQ